MPLRLLLVLATTRLAVAQENDNNQRISPSSAVVGFIVCKSNSYNSGSIFVSFSFKRFWLAVAFLLLILWCGVQRRRRRRSQRPASRPGFSLLLPLQSGRVLPNGMQYSTPVTSTPYDPQSEYPVTGAAEFAPPPYVKEGNTYPPPTGSPPPPIDAPIYSPPPGPPPQAHTAHNSVDFGGEFRAPPPSS
ncbi:hypothetical protein DFH07DRAFT_813706 [Mycena maculata]|uniref:Transmembrane protein n=1 Tax=Mycena maculata TaxID=230809 RepID=A0AAD7JE00_9AGAR|nr:hypothetical protein DFH07DRAFT_813706 [Mycena maculata]